MGKDVDSIILSAMSTKFDHQMRYQEMTGEVGENDSRQGYARYATFQANALSQLLPRECSMSSQKHNVSRHAYLPQAEDFVNCVAE